MAPSATVRSYLHSCVGFVAVHGASFTGCNGDGHGPFDSRGAVGDGVGEAVGSVEVGGGRVGEAAVAVDDDRAMGRCGRAGGIGERIAVDIGGGGEVA